MIEVKNAKITSVQLGFEGHGILTAFLHLDYGDSSAQGFGGYSLDSWACAVFVRRVLEVVGVDNWEDLKGQTVRVKAEGHKVHAIGNIIKDKWFNPKEEFEAHTLISTLIKHQA